MTWHEVCETLDRVEFGLLMDAEFYVGGFDQVISPPELAGTYQFGAGAYLQVRFTDPDTMTRQNGRKWLLSQWMTKSELVQTALMACLAAVEHEARESFTYNGEAIYGPHFDVDDLVEGIRSAGLSHDLRPDGAWVAR